MASIRDVAKKAGVSVGTVSRAFNNYKDIKPATKRHIFEVAEELNYSPNIVAKSLSSKKKPGIGIIVFGLLKSNGKDNIAWSTLKGIYEVVNQSKVETAIYAVNDEIQKKTILKKFCRERNLAGIIVQGMSTEDPFYEELLTLDIPCVVIDMLGKKDAFTGVTSDNVLAAKEMANYILQNGHTDVFILAGSKDALVTMERTAGFFEAFQENGKELKRSHIIYAGYDEDVAYQQTKELLGSGQKVTAIICMSDLMAIAAIKAIKEEGLRVPEDISVSGFDGIPLAEYVKPPLTTIKQDFQLIASKATEILIDKIHDIKADETYIIDHQLIVRSSVCKIDNK